MIRLGGNVALNLLYVIKREIGYNSFSLNNCKSSKIRIAQGFIPDEITFLKCQLHRQFCAVWYLFFIIIQLTTKLSRSQRKGIVDGNE